MISSVYSGANRVANRAEDGTAEIVAESTANGAADSTIDATANGAADNAAESAAEKLQMVPQTSHATEQYSQQLHVYMEFTEKIVTYTDSSKFSSDVALCTG
eukprot:gene963-10729_t